jgi:hypothetical protein
LAIFQAEIAPEAIEVTGQMMNLTKKYSGTLAPAALAGSPLCRKE